MTPLVSIIIPNYNYCKFLENRFCSIFNQTFQDYEIIFLDDASTDRSVELVKEKFKEKIKKIEINPINSGNPFVQWNKGVDLAEGEFIWIAEADDSCDRLFLESMISTISQSSSIGLVYCKTIPIDENGIPIDENFYNHYVSDLSDRRWEESFFNNGQDELRKYLSQKNTIINASGVLFRRQAFISSGYATEELKMCGDWMTYCKILKNWNIAYNSQSLNFHRQHQTKHTKNSVLNLTYFYEFLKVQKYVLTLFDNNDIEIEKSFTRFMGEWDRLTISSYGRIGLVGNLLIAKMSASYYKKPYFLYKTLIHLSKNLKKSAGISI